MWHTRMSRRRIVSSNDADEMVLVVRSVRFSRQADRALSGNPSCDLRGDVTPCLQPESDVDENLWSSSSSSHTSTVVASDSDSDCNFFNSHLSRDSRTLITRTDVREEGCLCSSSCQSSPSFAGVATAAARSALSSTSFSDQFSPTTPNLELSATPLEFMSTDGDTHPAIVSPRPSLPLSSPIPSLSSRFAGEEYPPIATTSRPLRDDDRRTPLVAGEPTVLDPGASLDAPANAFPQPCPSVWARSAFVTFRRNRSIEHVRATRWLRTRSMPLNFKVSTV
eukprot:m.133620 g.133620  ORF g.133620 m.133620 type:complete len:280 (-) comp52421_c0_seq3:174-1013(-)